MEFGGGASFNIGSEFVRNSNYADRDMEEDNELGVCSDDDASSSVGSRSDSSDDEDEEDERSCKEPVESMDALKQVVPVSVRKGISKFYSGKSKSFTSLADAVSSASVKEFAKPETLYPKKKNNLLGRKIPESKHANASRSIPGGPLKEFAHSSYANRHGLDEPCSTSASPPFRLPPLHPQRKKIQNPGSSVSPPLKKCSPWRSFSVSDLQSMVHNA